MKVSEIQREAQEINDDQHHKWVRETLVFRKYCMLCLIQNPSLQCCSDYLVWTLCKATPAKQLQQKSQLRQVCFSPLLLFHTVLLPLRWTGATQCGVGEQSDQLFPCPSKAAWQWLCQNSSMHIVTRVRKYVHHEKCSSFPAWGYCISEPTADISTNAEWAF